MLWMGINNSKMSVSQTNLKAQKTARVGFSFVDHAYSFYVASIILFTYPCQVYVFNVSTSSSCVCMCN